MRVCAVFVCVAAFTAVGLADDVAPGDSVSDAPFDKPQLGVRIDQIPVAQIKKCLPDHWRIQSISPVPTISGWVKLAGSGGVRVTISRTPYTNELRRTKSGALEVPVPRVSIYVFPLDFEGKHANTDAVFRQDKIITTDSPKQPRVTADIVADQYTRIGSWYVFHNKPTFPDWTTPAADVIKGIKEAPLVKLRAIVEAHRKSGAFDYNLKSRFNDSNVVGWCISALKAGHLASTNDLREAARRAIEAAKEEQ